MKYKQNNYEFIILPMFAVEDEQNSDLMSAVFIKKGNKTQYSGELGGCISRIGADIDNDGFSEIITMQCESGEGDHKGLSKLYPKVIDMNYIGG